MTRPVPVAAVIDEPGRCVDIGSTRSTTDGSRLSDPCRAEKNTTWRRFTDPVRRFVRPR